MKKSFLTLVIVLFVIIVNAKADFYEITPSHDDIYINNNTIINVSASPYSIIDENGNGVLIINASNIILDCNGSVLEGYGNGTGIRNPGFVNVTIINCNVTGYHTGIDFSGKDGRVLYSNLSYNSAFGISIHSSVNCEIGKNTILGLNDSGILIENSDYVKIDGNWISHSGTGVNIVRSKRIYLEADNMTYNNLYGLRAAFSVNLTVHSSYIADNSMDIYILNSTCFDTEDTSFGSMVVLWNVVINVTDINGEPIEDAHIEIFSRNGERIPLTSDTTSPDGLTEEQGIEEYLINSSGRYDFTPHTINISKQGYHNVSVAEVINESKIIHVIMYPESDTYPPEISYNISPKNPIKGENVSICINASDVSGIDSVWAVVILPNSSTDVINLQNGVAFNYTVFLEGVYNITLHANDTVGNEINISDSFVVISDVLDINSTIEGYNGTALNSTLTVYYTNTTDQYLSQNSEDGAFHIENIPAGFYDFLFSCYDGRIRIFLMKIDVSENTDGMIKVDFLDNPEPNFGSIYAIETTYNFSGAVIKIFYNESDFGNESFLQVYKCGYWNFSGRVCEGNWNPVNATQD
ncbi:MAG TPA: hypothetical protein ENG00_00460, partial [Candidatus Aenigmarchaeota archaeon]|nr:hypothetical protein [Candidatus Aenigmarchaeota archaeon]